MFSLEFPRFTVKSRKPPPLLPAAHETSSDDSSSTMNLGIHTTASLTAELSSTADREALLTEEWLIQPERVKKMVTFDPTLGRGIGMSNFGTLSSNSLNEIHDRHRPYARPEFLYRNLKNIGNFSWGQQEDAHDFAYAVLNSIQKSLLSNEPSKHSFKQEETSLIYQLFGGYMKSVIKCKRCSHLLPQSGECVQRSGIFDLSLTEPPHEDTTLSLIKMKAIHVLPLLIVLAASTSNLMNIQFPSGEKCKVTSLLGWTVQRPACRPFGNDSLRFTCHTLDPKEVTSEIYAGSGCKGSPKSQNMIPLPGCQADASIQRDVKTFCSPTYLPTPTADVLGTPFGAVTVQFKKGSKGCEPQDATSYEYQRANTCDVNQRDGLCNEIVEGLFVFEQCGKFFDPAHWFGQ
ncbi:deubiquitinating enzyme 1-like [Planoprotostelium fungivorum]|uniref:Deubiquitinating enzyme 1-like n=1 Tax=Planoprotostelium fungivorum TaxID=1890364 RepID=A0A2P6N060_9EUKA|nr:deubiquitinating enzyme 1-like [Planoprotostelium fungivorum]